MLERIATVGTWRSSGCALTGTHLQVQNVKSICNNFSSYVNLNNLLQIRTSQTLNNQLLLFRS